MFQRSFFVLIPICLMLCLPQTAHACSGGLHIEVQRSGVYALDYAAIVERQPGLADCRSDDLVLHHRNDEIALHITGDHDGRFVAGTRLEWVGEMLHGPQSWFDPFSQANTYILTAMSGAHARMRESTPATAGAAAALARSVHLEQENMMIRLNQTLVKPGEEPDVMQWAKLTHADPQPFSFEFDLPDLDTHAGTRHSDGIVATINFRGMSDVPPPNGTTRVDDHAVELRLNGIALPLLSWDGRNEVRKQIRLPLSALRAKGNTLSLRIPVRHASWDANNPVVDVVMYNWIEMTYPIAGNLDASDAPLLRDDANPAVPIELSHGGAESVALYSADGRTQQGLASSNRYRFALGAAAGAELYPVIGTHFLKPSLLRAVVDQGMRTQSAGYDYLIVAHPSLMQAIEPLAELHRRRGLKVAVLNVDNVYDEFNGGIEHPQAIRDLVGWGVAHWQNKPRYVLLVGDASFDIRHNQPNDLNYAKWATQPHEMLYPGHFDAIPGTPYTDTPKDLATRNLIPTWQYPSEEGQSASDNAFVTLKTDDFHPSIAIGRFPVVTPEEVSAIVKKTIAYITQPELGPWRHNAMFIADETDYFQNASTQIAADLDKQGFVTEKVYALASEKDNLAHQTEIRDGINQGDLLVHFIGHGGRFIWRTGPPDLHKNHDLFTLDDVSGLKNDGHLPMILSMTCYSAPFDNPTEDSIGERFLREPDKGAVAVFAASWRNSPYPEYSKQLIAELLKPGQTIGDAIVVAKGGLRDRTLVETYNLLGDPALVLKRPSAHVAIAREPGYWQTSVAVRLPQNDFDGNVTVNWIDAGGKTLASHSYQSQDQQFVLTAPAGDIASVQIYAADLRSGSDSLGSLDLRPPPPPKPVAKTVPATIAAPAKTVAVPATVTATPPARSNLPDQITRLGFDTRPPQTKLPATPLVQQKNPTPIAPPSSTR